eukprot:scaffold1190_cov393-Prasinococcus_capsulatus_cf.AAC.21
MRVGLPGVEPEASSVGPFAGGVSPLAWTCGGHTEKSSFSPAKEHCRQASEQPLTIAPARYDPGLRAVQGDAHCCIMRPDGCGPRSVAQPATDGAFQGWGCNRRQESRLVYIVFHNVRRQSLKRYHVLRLTAYPPRTGTVT